MRAAQKNAARETLRPNQDKAIPNYELQANAPENAKNYNFERVLGRKYSEAAEGLCLRKENTNRRRGFLIN